MTEQELKKEVAWMKRVTKNPMKTDESVGGWYHPKRDRFIRGLMALGVNAELHNSWDEWKTVRNLSADWNLKYPNGEIYVCEPYPCTDTDGYEAHIEDETFRFTD